MTTTPTTTEPAARGQLVLEELAALRTEVQRCRNELRELDRRVTALERRAGIR